MHLESDAIRTVLEPDEQLLWSGRPGRLRPADAVPLATGLLLTAYAIWSARQHGLDRGTLFAFVIAMGNLGAAAYALASRLGTAYGVSSKRILIVSTVPRRRVVSLDLLTLGHLSVENHGDGSGTVVLEPARFGLVEGASLPAQDERPPAPRLHRIKDAQAVRDLIDAARGKTEGPLGVQLPDREPSTGTLASQRGCCVGLRTTILRAAAALLAVSVANGVAAGEMAPPPTEALRAEVQKMLDHLGPETSPRQRRAVEESLILEAPLTPEAIGRAEEAHRAVRRRSLSVPERFGPEQPLDVRFADYTLGEDGEVIPGSTGWTTAERRRFSRFLRRMLPIVRDLYGDPFERWTITVVKDLYYTGSWIFIPSLLEIHTDGSWNPRLLAHEFIHAFRGRRTLTNDANWNYTPTLSGFEEGFAEGVAYMAMNAYVAQYCAGGDCSGADVPSYYRWDSYLEGVYDFSNDASLTSESFWSDSGGTLKFYERYLMAAAAVMRLETAVSSFSRRFNEEYYARIRDDDSYRPSGRRPSRSSRPFHPSSRGCRPGTGSTASTYSTVGPSTESATGQSTTRPSTGSFTPGVRRSTSWKPSPAARSGPTTSPVVHSWGTTGPTSTTASTVRKVASAWCPMGGANRSEASV